MSFIHNEPWAARINPQPMFDILASAREKENEGHSVLRMEIGDTGGFTNTTMHKLISEFASEPFRYSPSSGEPKLIQSVAKSQWPTFNYDTFEIVIAPANFLITASLAAITTPGDTILLPDPGFPTYKLAADFLGLKVCYYKFNESFEDFPVLSEAIAACSEVPKVVLINNPSNPIGKAYAGEGISKQLSILKSSMPLSVIIDETYVNLVYDNINPIIECDGAIRIRSFSKEHCAPALRVGYAIAPKRHAKTISNFVSLTNSCSPSFIQLAIAKYLDSNESLIFVEQVKKAMMGRINVLKEIIPKHLLSVIPNSAFYSLINSGDSDHAFKVLLNSGVSICPGSKFGSVSRNSIRVSLAGSSEDFERDINKLGVSLKLLSRLVD